MQLFFKSEFERPVKALKRMVLKTTRFFVALFIGLSILSVSVCSAGETTESSQFSTTVTSPKKVPFFLTDIPPEAQHLVPAFHHIISISQSITKARADLKKLRSDYDATLTQISSMKSELDVVTQQRQELEQEFAALESAERERFEQLKRELAMKLENELGQAKEQINQELNDEISVRLQAFESRQREAIQKALSQELQFEERELQQLAKEIEVQAQELSDRLDRLDVNSNIGKSLEKTTQDLLQKKRIEVEAKRRRIREEREALYTKQREDVVHLLHQQNTVEMQKRLTVKEASLRSSMAELLARTRNDSEAKVEEKRKKLSDIRKRYGKLAEDYAAFTAQEKTLNQQISVQARAMEGIEAERQASLVKLEQAFLKKDTDTREKSIDWFGKIIQSTPQDLSVDLGMLHQRLVAVTEQQRRLEEQRKVLRERQLALQVSREMEAQYQRIQEQQRRKEMAKAEKAEELLGSAKRFASQGNYDEAIRVISKAQSINPPQLQEIAIVREELIAEKQKAEHHQQVAEIEKLFTHAMNVFEQGRYDEAVTLFEQVISKEASMKETVPGSELVEEAKL